MVFEFVQPRAVSIQITLQFPIIGVIGERIEVLETTGESPPAYQQLAGQARLYGIISSVIALTIVFMMVVKPFP